MYAASFSFLIFQWDFLIYYIQLIQVERFLLLLDIICYTQHFFFLHLSCVTLSIQIIHMRKAVEWFGWNIMATTKATQRRTSVIQMILRKKITLLTKLLKGVRNSSLTNKINVATAQKENFESTSPEIKLNS